MAWKRILTIKQNLDYLQVELTKAGHSRPGWEQTFESNIGATWETGYGPFDEGISRMFEELKG